MTDTQAKTAADRTLPRKLRLVILAVSITLAALFVLFSAAAMLMPSTKSGRIAWPEQLERQAAPKPAP